MTDERKKIMKLKKLKALTRYGLYCLLSVLIRRAVRHEQGHEIFRS